MNPLSGDYPAEKLVSSLIKPDGKYTQRDREEWVCVALGQIAPAGSWPMEFFRDLYHAKDPVEAIKIARAARTHFEKLWVPPRKPEEES